MRIRFNKVGGTVKMCGGVRYLELCNSYNKVYYGVDSRIYNAYFYRINYVISEKSGVTDSINHNFARITIDSYNSLPIEKKDLS